ncbi:MAG: hypothetical protein HYX78_14265 [Armatimonadetes bacterium]|nr:hypothetical protein [Armatimonadota bacterium]
MKAAIITRRFGETALKIMTGSSTDQRVREAVLIEADEARCKYVADELWNRGLWRIPGVEDQPPRVWRISPEPFAVEKSVVDILRRLGPALLAFYAAANSLYLRSKRPWVNEYLDLGKPESLIEHAHMNYQKRRLPGIIRPDILLTEEGPRITELDSVPGGMGQLDAMSSVYGELGSKIIGSTRGMREGFDRMIRGAAGKDDPTLAIVVSDESADYRPEMDWLARELRSIGRSTWMVRPEEITFTEDGLFMEVSGERVRLDAVYRFFELFDLKNIPKAELIAYAAKKKRVAVTPPYKHHLEEKMLLALLHHPMLEDYWVEELGPENYMLLRELAPQTWILDPRPAPPHAVIAGFSFRGRPVQDWRVIKEATQKERRLIIKPSGFSPLAWGGRGVVVGHDVPAEEWSSAVERALAGFRTLPYVLQPFNEGKRLTVRYYDQEADNLRGMQGRVRLSPYYYVTDGGASLAGVLATVAPLDKKLIHGMVDAVMAPCMVADNA